MGPALSFLGDHYANAVAELEGPAADDWRGVKRDRGRPASGATPACAGRPSPPASGVTYTHITRHFTHSEGGRGARRSTRGESATAPHGPPPLRGGGRPASQIALARPPFADLMLGIGWGVARQALTFVHQMTKFCAPVKYRAFCRFRLLHIGPGP